jgi:hypothetical protein
MSDFVCLPEYKEPLCLPDYYLSQWIIDMLEEAGDRAFDIMVEQYKINPDAFEALYS